MVSKASDDLPEPDNPVITTSLLRGISTSMFFRLCTRAPRTDSQLWAMGVLGMRAGPVGTPAKPSAGAAPPGRRGVYFAKRLIGKSTTHNRGRARTRGAH